MRKDMFKVIVERPRRGGDRKGESKRGKGIDEDSASREGIRTRHRSRKWLNENLRPLERWLGSQVGRPWDKAYAELCEGIDRRSTVQQHIHQHVEDFVAVRVVVIGGALHQVGRWGEPQPLERYWAPALYVDPDSGLLRENRGRLRARREYRRDAERDRAPPPDRRELSPWRQLHRLGGVWYEVELAPLPAKVHGRDIAGNPNLFGRHGVYACSKRQLSRRELREHALHNEDKEDHHE